MLRVIAFSMILVFAGAAPALAQDDDYARNGIYLGVKLAGAWYTEVKDDREKEIGGLPPSTPFPTDSVTVQEPLGLGARVGYRFHPRLAAEAQFQWFTDSTVQFVDEDATVTASEFETLTFTGNLKGYLLTGRIQPFLLAGAGLMRLKAKDALDRGIRTSGEDFAARFGAGIDFYVTPNVAAVAEGGYLLPTGKLDGLDHVVWSIGLQYRF